MTHPIARLGLFDSFPPFPSFFAAFSCLDLEIHCEDSPLPLHFPPPPRRDVIFLLDGSTSVTDDVFDAFKRLVNRLIDDLVDDDVGKDALRVGTMSFGGNAAISTLTLKASERMSVRMMKKHVTAMNRPRGGTKIGMALKAMRKEFESEENVPRGKK